MKVGGQHVSANLREVKIGHEYAQGTLYTCMNL